MVKRLAAAALLAVCLPAHADALLATCQAKADLVPSGGVMPGLHEMLIAQCLSEQEDRRKANEFSQWQHAREAAANSPRSGPAAALNFQGIGGAIVCESPYSLQPMLNWFGSYQANERTRTAQAIIGYAPQPRAIDPRHFLASNQCIFVKAGDVLDVKRDSGPFAVVRLNGVTLGVTYKWMFDHITPGGTVPEPKVIAEPDGAHNWSRQ